MRILHTESSLGWGGQEIRVLTEARGVSRRGHEVAIAAPPGARIFAAAPDYGLARIELAIARKSVRGLAAMRAHLASTPYAVYAGSVLLLAVIPLLLLGAHLLDTLEDDLRRSREETATAQEPDRGQLRLVHHEPREIVT